MQPMGTPGEGYAEAECPDHASSLDDLNPFGLRVPVEWGDQPQQGELVSAANGINPDATQMAPQRHPARSHLEANGGVWPDRIRYGVWCSEGWPWVTTS